MRDRHKYIYLSGHVSVWLRLYVFGTLAMFVAFFAFGVPMWFSPVISTAVLGVLFLINLGMINFPQKDGLIIIRDRHRRLDLSTDLETRTWWHYIHRGKAYANDIHVILHVEDSTGREVYFSETIMFETRHPNEAPFRDEHIPDEAMIVPVQRVDKVHAFLKGQSE